MPFTLVLAGSGDIGRTVLVQACLDRELRRRWPRSIDEVVVRTAGVDALDGMPPSPHLETVAARRGFDVEAHRATGMTRELATGADLLLAMTRKQRAQLVLQHPEVRGKTFSLIEFAVLLHAAADAPHPSLGRGRPLGEMLRVVVPVVAARSASVGSPKDEGEWDLPDPFACGLDVYESVATVVEDMARTMAADIATISATRTVSAVRSA